MKPYFLPPLVLQKFIWIPTRFLFTFFGHIEIRGLENLKDIKGPVIFACNHSSESDPFFIPGSLPFFSRFSPTFYTSREKSFYENSGWRKHFYGGIFFKAWGSYPVYVGLQDYRKSLPHHMRIIRDGGSPCIFPEGRKTPDGMIQPARGGVAYLAHATDTPIVPVYIGGVFRITLKEFLSGRRRLSVTYGKPIHIDSPPQTPLSPLDYKRWAERVMREVEKLRVYPSQDRTFKDFV